MFKHLDSKPLLLISTFGALLVYFVTPQWLQQSTRIIIVWNLGVVCFLASILLMMGRTTLSKMKLQAQKQDESRWLILGVVVLAACISLWAIVFMLDGNKNLTQSIIILHLTLSLLTISSWLLIQVMFALHYAHLYYSDRQLTPTATPLEFREKSPDYTDFLYFSLGIGMTCQVADVQIASRMLRRFTLVHQVLAFFFNTLILALAINIMASSI